MFASSTENDDVIMAVTDTPPYSSDDPTLPVIGSTVEQSTSLPRTLEAGKGTGTNIGKRRKAQDLTHGTAIKKPIQSQTPHTIHLFLYEPWRLLPPDLIKLVESEGQLRNLQDTVPVVFTRNQNIQSAINRLTAYLGAYSDTLSSMKMPGSLWQEDCVIAISAQGDGTTKLVGIIDMVKRIVAPSEKYGVAAVHVGMWWMYTSLTSVETEWSFDSKGGRTKAINDEARKSQQSQEGEAFEPMDVDEDENQDRREVKSSNLTRKRKIPVLTVWISKKQILAFRHVFGEQPLTVRRMRRDEDIEACQ